MTKTAPKSGSEHRNLTIRIKREMLEKIDLSIKSKYVTTTRTSWVLQAIYDKLEKEHAV